MFSNEMFPPLCIVPPVCLRQAEDTFQKSEYSRLHSTMLLLSLHQKQHLLFGLLILLCNKINFQFISDLFFFIRQYSAADLLLLMSHLLYQTIILLVDLGGGIKKGEKGLICRIVVLANALPICGYRGKCNLFKANDEVNMLAWFCVFD